MSLPVAPGRVLVTGAGGKTGIAVILELRRRGVPVRALVRQPHHRAVMEGLGVDEVVEGDLRDGDVVSRAVSGVDAVYHICPNVHPEEIEIGRWMIAAARASSVGHFVFHSVLHPQTEAMPHHWAKLRVEEMLLEAELPFTILQPAPYMQNVLAQRPHIARDGVYSVPYALETRVVMVDLEDVAEVAGRVLAEPGHLGATYELCGSDALSQTEIAEVLTAGFGRAVRPQTVPISTWTEGATAAGMGEYQVRTLVKMFRYYERHGMAGSSAVLEGLLGRPATTFAQTVDRLTGGVVGGAATSPSGAPEEHERS